MKYKKLNIGWNAEPNAPEIDFKTEGDKLKITFYLNAFVFENVEEEDKGELTFTGCF